MTVIRCARLDLPVDLPAMEVEVAALPDRWKPHFQTAHYDGEWAALPLRSIEGQADELLPFPLGGGPANYAATPLLALCPAIQRFLTSLACPVLSARLLRLKQGAVIKPHRDASLAFEQREARLHVPIFTNPDVEFFIDEQRVVMEPGSCWYINANLTHYVTNRGMTDRIHLVVDCGVDDWLRGQFAQGAVVHSIVRRDPAELRQMMIQLRLMNTPAALAIVDELEQELVAGEL
jgi:hypothetical protein